MDCACINSLLTSLELCLSSQPFSSVSSSRLRPVSPTNMFKFHWALEGGRKGTFIFSQATPPFLTHPIIRNLHHDRDMNSQCQISQPFHVPFNTDGWPSLYFSFSWVSLVLPLLLLPLGSFFFPFLDYSGRLTDQMADSEYLVNWNIWRGCISQYFFLTQSEEGCLEINSS